jgi:hypothetical protein
LSTKARAEEALADVFGDRPGLLDGDHRAEELATLLVATLGEDELRAALVDIGNGDGGEVKPRLRDDGSWQRPKLHSAYSSAGLALNVFGPWRLEPTSLTIAGCTGFEALTFEKQLRIFRGGRAPNLDVFLTAPGRALAIESKLTEHLDRKPPAEFSDAYDRLAGKVDPSWWAMYERLKDEPEAFTYLDAAQLVKHYFGLKTYCSKTAGRATLLYLYWKPEDADEGYPELGVHAREAVEFREGVCDPVVAFETLTYPDLWESWSELSQPSWLGDHVAALRE